MRMTMYQVGVAAIAAVVLGLPPRATAQIQVIQTGPGLDTLQLPAPGRQLKTGTGRITGRVIATESGTPIRRAQVRITGPDIMPKTSMTDGDGRYEFRDLPAARFTLQATKSGYVSIQYGQTRPFESGRQIELADKQVLENADIAMPRGSVISGRIVDEFGEPVADANVTAMRQTWSGGRRRLVPAPGRVAQTNDLGQYRIYGLPPGEYFVSATLRGGMELMPVEMAVTAARISGEAGPSGSTPSSGYAPTYFPGTQNVGEAQRISLNVGQETANTDFALIPVRLSKITGIIMGSDGKPLGNAIVSLAPGSRSDATLVNPLNTTRTNRDGAFTLNSVPPGEYQLQANSVQVFTTSDSGNTMVFSMRMGGEGGGGDSEFGSLPVVIAGEDLNNLVLTTSKGATASGRVIFEGGNRPPSMTAVRISAMAADAGTPLSLGGPRAPGAVKADGTFELSGLAGLRLIRAVGLPPGWMLKSVRVNGSDVTDTGTEFKPGDHVTGIEVVLTSETTSITGSVTGADGAPVKDYTVVIFSDDPDLWRAPMTRWVTGTRPDQDGRFKVQNMPPGGYYAIAVEYLPTGEWGDPDLLDRLKTKARRFTLAEGSSETLELKLSDGT